MSTISLTHLVSKEGIIDNLMCEVKLLEMTKYEIFTCFSKKKKKNHLHSITITIKYQTLLIPIYHLDS